MNDLSLRQLRYFVAISDELHVGRAAARLHLSQPALSQQLRRLERDLGVELFTRRGRGIELSPAGVELLPAARQTLHAAGELVQAAQRSSRRDREHLAIGLLAGGALELTPRLLRSFAAACPLATFTLNQYDFTDPSAGLAGGDSDVAIVRLPFHTHGLELVGLFDEQRVAVLPEHHPLAHQAALSVNQLLDQPWCCVPTHDALWRDFWRAATHRGEHPFQLGAQTSTFDEMLEAVGAGQGVAVVSASTERFYHRPGLRFLPVPDLEPTTVAVASRNDAPGVLAATFMQLGRDLASGHAWHDVPDATPPSLDC